MQYQKIYLTGKGQLGTYYQKYFSELGAQVTLSGSEVDVRNFDLLKQKISEFKPDLIIHTAAKTNIDWCEQNKTEAFEINTLGTDNVAKISQELGIKLLYLSSGCVLESKSASDAQSEAVTPSPLCFYSWTKVWGEQMVLHRAGREGLNALILRPRQLLSATVDPRNALTKMLTYTKFIDTPNSCTVVEDLMWATERLLELGVTGVYNVVNPGVATPFEIATLLKKIVEPKMNFVKISKDELNRMTLAERVDAVLATDKLSSLGVTLPEIHVRMSEIMEQLKQNLLSPAGQNSLNATVAETQKKLALIKKN